MLMWQSTPSNTLQAARHEARATTASSPIPRPPAPAGGKDVDSYGRRHQPGGLQEHQEQGRRPEVREVHDQRRGAEDARQGVRPHCRSVKGGTDPAFTDSTQEAKAFQDILADQRRAAAARCRPRPRSRPTSATPSTSLLAAGGHRASRSPTADVKAALHRGPGADGRGRAADVPADGDHGHAPRARTARARRAPRRAPAPVPGSVRPRRDCRTCCCCPAILLELLDPHRPDARRRLDELRRADPVLHPRTGGGAVRRARTTTRSRSTSSSPIGKDLLHSFTITVRLHRARRSACLAASGCPRRWCCSDTFRGRGLLRTLFLVPYALPVYAAVITWSFMFQRDNGLVNHVLHRPACTSLDHASFWLIGDNSFFVAGGRRRSGGPGRSRS